MSNVIKPGGLTGYRNWSDVEFKKKIRINRETFDIILDRIRPELEKKPTNAKPNPLTVGRQLASTLQVRLWHILHYSWTFIRNLKRVGLQIFS